VKKGKRGDDAGRIEKMTQKRGKLLDHKGGLNPKEKAARHTGQAIWRALRFREKERQKSRKMAIATRYKFENKKHRRGKHATRT